jgi:cysteine synthase A
MVSIGDTPLFRLSKLEESGFAEIYVKYEGGNPTGSMKDRMALSMIEGAERRGELKPGGRVVEYTGGSTGSSLAMVCAAKGYKAHLVSSDAFAAEKLQTMRAFGAEVELIESEQGMITADLLNRMIARAKALSREENTFWTDQVNNKDNRSAYRKMGYEILKTVPGPIDAFLTGVGTGGCFSGNAEVLKAAYPKIKCIAIEPHYVRNISGGGTRGKHRLEGIGLGFIPSVYRRDLQDGVMAVKDEDAYATARKLAMEEGIFGGITSGANVWAALQLAKEMGPTKRIVTVIIDSGLRYLSGDLYR